MYHGRIIISQLSLLAVMYYVVLPLTVLPELYFYFLFYCKSNRFSRLWKRHFLPPLHLPRLPDTTCYSNQLSSWSSQFITGSLGRYWRLAEVRRKHVCPIWRSPSLLAKASSPSRIINSPRLALHLSVYSGVTHRSHITHQITTK